MMKKTRNGSIAALAFAMLTATGVATTVPLYAAAETGGGVNCGATGVGFPVDECIVIGDAAASWRYIGISSGSTCPVASTWTVGKVFARPGSGPIPPGLNRYCVYTTQQYPSKPAFLEELVCQGDAPQADCLVRVDPDSLSMGLMGAEQTVEALTWKGLREQFLAQAGEVGPVPAGPATVRLAVVDTEPTGYDEDRNGPGNSPHGFALLAMARDLLCPDTGNCSVELRSALGLPLQICSDNPAADCFCGTTDTGYCSNTAQGGYVGTIADLARAIHLEVADWESAGTKNLVINLSVAWDPVFGGAAPISNGSAAVQAVHAAITDARCRGALVVAAAGNRVSGPGVAAGPLYPAAWEQFAAPDLATCQGLLGMMPDPADFPPAGSYYPLVVAVGSVTNNGAEAGSRVDGEPQIVAFGDHAVAQVAISGGVGPTATLTGTSVAAAVVSAAAAAVWHYRPAATPFEVLQNLYDSGTALGRGADFCLGGNPGCGPVVRISACAAVVQACTALPGDPACAAFECPFAQPVLPEIPTAEIEAQFAGDTKFDVSTLTQTVPVPECKPGYKLNLEALQPMPDNPCPHIQFYGIQATPWVDGQPAGQSCELCPGEFRSPGKLFIEIKRGFEGQLRDVTLVCDDTGYRLPETLTSEERYQLIGIPASCEATSMFVSYRVVNGSSTTASVVSPVLLVADRDDDNIQDGIDNCVLVANPMQRDTDADGLGNFCDGDFNGDCVINFTDLGYMKQQFFSTDPDADLNGDGAVNFADLALLKDQAFGPPGPSALDNPCQ